MTKIYTLLLLCLFALTLPITAGKRNLRKSKKAGPCRLMVRRFIVSRKS